MTCLVSYDPCDTRSRDHRTACIHGQCSQPRPPGLSSPFLPLGAHTGTNSLSQFLSKLHTLLIWRIQRVPWRCFLSHWEAWLSFETFRTLPPERIMTRYSKWTKIVSVCIKVSTKITPGINRSPAVRSQKDCGHRNHYPSRPDASCWSFKEKRVVHKGFNTWLRSLTQNISPFSSH
jgi:hypothetical protein